MWGASGGTNAAPPAMYPAVGGAASEGVQVGVVGVDVQLAERVRQLQVRLDVTEEIVKDLLSISGTDIVIIADDSGSMNNVADMTNVSAPVTRWGELKNTLLDLVEMLLLVDHTDGFTLKFLNDPRWYTVTSRAQVESLFHNRRPAGITPLASALRSVFVGEWATAVKRAEIKEAILLVATDGEPTDTSFSGLSELIRNRPRQPFPYYVTFLMCTEQDDLVDRYDACIDNIPGCDVVDDYVSERKQVLAAGRERTFSRCKWLAKAVLGGKMPKYDKMDEKGCCSVM